MLHKIKIRQTLRTATCILILVIAAGCQKRKSSSYSPVRPSSAQEGDQSANESADSNASQDPDAIAAEIAGMTGLSNRNTVRFKKKDLLENDILKAFDLTAPEICQELGSKSCLDEVHHLSLGGVDAYKRGVFSGVTESMVTTPIALERIALSGCSERTRRDLANPGAAIFFGGISLGADGAISNEDSMRTAVDNLYFRFLRRHPEERETTALVSMYGDVAAKAPGTAGFEWARLSCYAVVTQVEFAFY